MSVPYPQCPYCGGYFNEWVRHEDCRKKYMEHLEKEKALHDKDLILQNKLQTHYNSMEQINQHPAFRQIQRKLIHALLTKPVDLLDSKEVSMLEDYITESMGHDCQDPEEHCSFCWDESRIAHLLGKIVARDEQIEQDVEAALLETEGERVC